MSAPRSPSCTCSPEFVAIVDAHELTDSRAHLIGCPEAIARPYPAPHPPQWETITVGGARIPPVVQRGPGKAFRPLDAPIVITVTIR